MVRSLFTAYTGLRNEEKRLDVISNNMANADTNAYKAEGTTSRAFSEVYAVKINDESEANTQRGIGSMSLGVRIGETYRDWNTGSFNETGNTYDFALSGKGFFTISMTDKNGQEHIRYTRDGSFSITKDGYLVTKDGDFVLGEDGERIQIPVHNGKPEVDQYGSITIDGEEIGKFGITDFEDYDYLVQYGENQYDAIEGATQIDAAAGILQGVLETSNVSIVDEMVNMITITRSYETNQKLIQTVDSLLEKAVNTIGRV